MNSGTEGNKKSVVHDKHIPSILFISLQLPTADYLHSMKTSEPKAQQVALDSSWKALSSRTNFRGCNWLERKHEVAVLIRAFRSCRFCAGRDLLAPSSNRNFGNCCSEGNPGFTAARGFNPAGGAPGGGPYCTLTTTKWFLQALSVIPMGSWGDVARRFTLIRWRAHGGTVAAHSYSADGRQPYAIVTHGGARNVRQCAAHCASGEPEAMLRHCF
ncbi:coatomer subunit gamma-like [Dorcoceras hygrometricum]|uniref:Coatomer subunit gamma-like n=1 Tax=Dorcoceras hygrometricum TaxID=472368 RepID=A0A2Z7A5R1_9LAMI|nr:coatomer subunit gamma-like [Dorcoceras hygrometricum]